MKKADVFFSIISGLAVSWIAIDFLGVRFWPAAAILPVLALIGLWVCGLIGKKYPSVYQMGKFALGGAFASMVDIKIFQLIYFFLPFQVAIKALSFILATFVKYFSDKHWSFSSQGEPASGRQKLYERREMGKFFMVAMGGLAINVISFYFLTRMHLPAIPWKLWQELSIILAALISAVWNFAGYKFIVFKK